MFYPLNYRALCIGYRYNFLFLFTINLNFTIFAPVWKNIRLGNDKSKQLVENLRSQVDQAIRSKNVKVGHEILEQINTLFIQLTMMYQCMGLIDNYNRTFSSHPWRDAGRARQLINRGLEIINNNPTTEALLPIARGILDLLPDEEAANAGGLLR